jgi:hypothetical protein
VDFPHKRERPYTYCAVCSYRRVKAYRDSSPVARERKREAERFRADRIRRERGQPPRNFKHKASVIDRRERIFLDPAPLLMEIERKCDGEYRWLARVSGVSERAIYRLRTGESAHVELANADKLAVGLGLTLELIYNGAGHLVQVPGHHMTNDLSNTL